MTKNSEKDKGDKTVSERRTRNYVGGDMTGIQAGVVRGSIRIGPGGVVVDGDVEGTDTDNHVEGDMSGIQVSDRRHRW